jgi:hypothetical protein
MAKVCEGVRQHIGRISDTVRELRKLFERATPKAKIKQTDVRVLFAREILTRFLAIAKLLKELVARDGIEPPTPAFSGPLTDSLKWFEINGCYRGQRAYAVGGLGWLRMIWAIFGSSMFAYCSRFSWLASRNAHPDRYTEV